MNAKDLFPSEEERKEVKSWLEACRGTVTKVTDEIGFVLFESDNSYENIRKTYGK